MSSSLNTFVTPSSTATETQHRLVFRTLMWALSYPGRIMQLPTPTSTYAACEQIGAALLDLETTFFAPDATLAVRLSRTGARSAPAGEAAYHFYPTLTQPMAKAEILAAIEQASVGLLLYPDQAATLVVGCTVGRGRLFDLRGPGITGQHELSVDDIPPIFWALREQKRNYPLGWDLFLVDGGQVVGLPRSTVMREGGTGGQGDRGTSTALVTPSPFHPFTLSSVDE